MSHELAPISYTQRRCNFRLGDGSPSFSEYQYANESLTDYVARMLEIRSQAQGHLSIAGWQQIEVYDDPEAAALFAEQWLIAAANGSSSQEQE